MWKYEFQKRKNDVNFPIKEMLVNVLVLKIDDGYQIAWNGYI